MKNEKVAEKLTQQIGIKLTSFRSARNLSAEEVAKTLGITNSQLSQYENGRLLPSLDKLISFCHYYGCSVDFLLGEDEFNVSPKDEFFKSLKKVLLGLPAEKKYIILEQVNFLIQKVLI